MQINTKIQYVKEMIGRIKNQIKNQIKKWQELKKEALP